MPGTPVRRRIGVTCTEGRETEHDADANARVGTASALLARRRPEWGIFTPLLRRASAPQGRAQRRVHSVDDMDAPARRRAPSPVLDVVDGAPDLPRVTGWDVAGLARQPGHPHPWSDIAAG